MSDLNFQMQLLSKAMSLRLKRHAAIAGNIANADTPGYRPKAVAFEDALQKASDSKTVGNVSKIREKVFKVDDGVPKANGNSVDLDAQMARMTENSLLYNATAEFVGRKMSMIKRVIE